jgi:hypothetical protein
MPLQDLQRTVAAVSPRTGSETPGRAAIGSNPYQRMIVKDPTTPGTSVPGTESRTPADTANRRELVPPKGWTPVPNAPFVDPALSLKARGLYAHLAVCHPNGYGLSVGLLAEEVKDGPTAVRSAIEELESRGYLIREVQRHSDGTFDAQLWTLTAPDRAVNA